MGQRSKVDWILESVALLAVVGAVVWTAYHWREMPVGRIPGQLSSRAALVAMVLVDVAAYLGLTLGAGRVFEIPAELDRQAPHVRPMLASMVIVMKAVLALFAAYLVWALVQAGLRRGAGISGVFLTGFTLAVPLPLVFYTLRLRKFHHSNK
jgi:hypothetical protein